MRSPFELRRLLVTIGVGALPVAAHAQQATTPDPLAPVRCYELADEEGLERLQALRLCTGATSIAPARCYAEADDRTDLLDLEIVRLCRMASSTAPVECALELDDTGDLTNSAIAGYCAAQAWPMVVAPGAGSAACVRAGLERTLLAERDVLELCQGSQDAGPVACFEAGDDELFLPDRDLIQLCARVIAYPQPWRWW